MRKLAYKILILKWPCTEIWVSGFTSAVCVQMLRICIAQCIMCLLLCVFFYYTITTTIPEDELVGRSFVRWCLLLLFLLSLRCRRHHHWLFSSLSQHQFCCWLCSFAKKWKLQHQKTKQNSTTNTNSVRNKNQSQSENDGIGAAAVTASTLVPDDVDDYYDYCYYDFHASWNANDPFDATSENIYCFPIVYCTFSSPLFISLSACLLVSCASYHEFSSQHLSIIHTHLPSPSSLLDSLTCLLSISLSRHSFIVIPCAFEMCCRCHRCCCCRGHSI